MKKNASKSDPGSTSVDHRLALSYALFTSDTSGAAVPIETGRTFNSGDRVRIMIESKRDAYLYVFDQEGEGDLRLLFPDPRVRRGIAKVIAQVPLSLPGSGAGDSDWFTLSGSAARERLVIVWSAAPMEAWPRERKLLDYPAGYTISQREFDRITVEGAGRVNEGSKGAEQPKMARGPKVSSKSLGSTVAVGAPGANRVIVAVDLRNAK